MNADGQHRLRGFMRTGLPMLAMTALLCLFAVVVMVATWSDLNIDASPVVVSAEQGSKLSSNGGLRLPGGREVEISGRVRATLPATGVDDARWVVRVPRDPFSEIWAQSDDWQSPRYDFYRPQVKDGLLPSSFRFALPANGSDRLELIMHMRGSMPSTLMPQLIREDRSALVGQRVVALNVMVYTGLFTLALVALALFWAVRERYYLALFGTTFIAGTTISAINGHLYVLPGLRLFGWWRDHGLWALMLLTMAAVLNLVAHFANIGFQHPRLPGAVRAATFTLIAVAGICLLRVSALLPLEAALAAAGLIATVVLAGWLLREAWQRKVAMVLPTAGLLLLMAIGCGLRVGVALGWVSDVTWTRYGFQLALLGLLAVLALTMIDRVGEYRHQRDRDRRARLDSEQAMARESARTDLTRTLQARLREQSPHDIEWSAFRVLLEYLLPHVRADLSLMIAHGYHGRDTMVVEPIEGKRRAEELMSGRLLELRRMAMMRQPLQQPFEDRGRHGRELVVPLTVDAHGWGVLLLQRNDNAEFSEQEMELAADLARLTLLHADEAVATQTLKRTAEVDALTGTYNRRGIDQWLARHFEGKDNALQAFSLLFVDIDHFKQINDLYGHACGDHCLRSIAEVLRTTLRQQDLLGRYGGEEFIALLPSADTNVGRMIAERLRSAVEDHQIEWQGQLHQITVSIGVSTRSAFDRSAGTMLERADRALYTAKREGRNRVHVSAAVFGVDG